MALTLPTINELITDASKRSAEHGNTNARHAAINALLTLREETLVRLADTPKPISHQQPPQLAFHFPSFTSAH